MLKLCIKLILTFVFGNKGIGAQLYQFTFGYHFKYKKPISGQMPDIGFLQENPENSVR